MTDSQHLGTETNLLQDQSRNPCQSRKADPEAKKNRREDPLAKESLKAEKDQPEGEDLEVPEDPEAEIEEEPILDPGADLVLPEDLLKTMMDTACMSQVL